MRLFSTFSLLFLCYLHGWGQNLFRSTCDGNLERVDSLLLGKSIDQKDDRGRSLLHWAAACDRGKVLDHLIEMEIQLNATDQQGRSAMHVAVQFKRTSILESLIRAQADTRWQKDFGGDLLGLAVLNKDGEMLDRLLDAGIAVDAVNQRGSTALEIAERTDATELRQYLLAKGADPNLLRKFEGRGLYMGQETPGESPKIFAPNFISTEEQEFGSVFSAKGTQFYYGVDLGGKNEIRSTEMVDGVWTKPVAVLSHQRYSFNDPYLSNAEDRLYFISNLALDGQGEKKDIDIWYVEKTAQGWSNPLNVGKEINTKGDEYYISFTADGSMYFSSNGHDREDSSRTDHDIYVSRWVEGSFQTAQALGPKVNTNAYEADVYVAPDESYLIFCSTRDGGFGRGDLYVSFKAENGQWTEAVNMGEAINTEHYEYCPFVSRDGLYLFYTSNQDIYWVSTTLIRRIEEGIKKSGK